jgi:peroxiredoxin Q/BCP
VIELAQLNVGDAAPDFEAETDKEERVRLSEFQGKTSVVLYFYPKDNTPGCTKEACSFRDNMGRLVPLGITVFGVSTDSVRSHQRFRDKFELNFPLISDKSKKISRAYGVLPRGKNTAQRSTFLIDKEGTIRHIWPKVKVAGHVDEILEKIQELGLG